MQLICAFVFANMQKAGFLLTRCIYMSSIGGKPVFEVSYQEMFHNVHLEIVNFYKAVYNAVYYMYNVYINVGV